MKVRSTKLWEYLKERGLLEASPEDIAKAKADYRRMYKKVWKQNKIPKRELRPGFTLREYSEIKIRAKEMHLTPTAYIKLLTLNSIANKATIPQRELLLAVLQRVSIAAIAVMKDESKRHIEEYVSNAETLLLHYLKENG